MASAGVASELLGDDFLVVVAAVLVPPVDLGSVTDFFAGATDLSEAAGGLAAARAGRFLGACSGEPFLAPAVARADLRVAALLPASLSPSPAASSIAAARFRGPSVSSSTLSCFLMYVMISACELNRLPSAL